MKSDADTGPILETARLVLRPPVVDDFERWAEMLADAESARFIGGVLPKPVAWRVVTQVRGAWALTGISMFSVIEKARDILFGGVGRWKRFGWPGPEVGWGVIPYAAVKGYALEAATAAIDYAFDTLGWSEVIHCIDPRNVRSQALARRLGSSIQRKAFMPPPFDHDEIDVWGQTRDEWETTSAIRRDTRY
jgi:RimJ/RimL family protein N-acetyltransferase